MPALFQSDRRGLILARFENLLWCGVRAGNRHFMLRFRSVIWPGVLLLYIVLAGTLWPEPQTGTKRTVLVEGQSTVSLDGEWSFLPVDDPRHKAVDFDDADWAKLNPWEGGYDALRPGYRGNSWFRTRFTVPVGTSLSGLAVWLPHRGWSVQFYLNGHLLHQTRQFTAAGEPAQINSKPEIVSIDSSLLKVGENVLALRGPTTGDTRFHGELRIGPERDLHFSGVQVLLWTALIAIVELFLGVYNTILFLQRRKERYYLYFGLLSFALGLWLLGFRSIIFYVWDDQRAYDLTTYFMVLLAPLAFYKFYITFFGISPRRKIPDIFYALVFVVFLLEYFLFGDSRFFMRYIFPVFAVSMLVLAVHIIYINGYAIRAGLPFARSMGLGLIVVTLTTLQSVLVFLHITSGYTFVNEGFFVLCLIFAFILAARYSKTFTHLEVAREQLQNLNASLENKVLDRTRIIESQKVEIEKRNRALERELELAGKMQASLLPGHLVLPDGVRVAFRYVPMLDVGGDFLDFHVDPEKEKISIFICDVTGHGVAAAMLASMVKMSLQDWGHLIDSPDKMLHRIHDSLEGKLDSHFVTASISTIDLRSGELTVANAGHPAAIVLRASGELEFLRPAGLPINEVLFRPYGTARTTLAPGDKLVVYTDGVSEASDENDAMFEDASFFPLLTDHVRMLPEDLCASIVQSIERFVGKTGVQEDDIALCICEFTGRSLTAV